MKPLAMQGQQQSMNMPPQPQQPKQHMYQRGPPQPTQNQQQHLHHLHHQGSSSLQQPSSQVAQPVSQQQPLERGAGGPIVSSGLPQERAAGYHPSSSSASSSAAYHRMHHSGQPATGAGLGMNSSAGPAGNNPSGANNNVPSNIPLPARLMELFEALKQEIESYSDNIGVYKSQRDELEHKINAQVHEMTLFQQQFYELEKAHHKMKAQHEDEITRLKRELERIGGGGRYDNYYSQTNGGEHVAKRLRADEPPNTTSVPSSQQSYYQQQQQYPSSTSQGSYKGYPPSSMPPQTSSHPQHSASTNNHGQHQLPPHHHASHQQQQHHVGPMPPRPVVTGAPQSSQHYPSSSQPSSYPPPVTQIQPPSGATPNSFSQQQLLPPHLSNTNTASTHERVTGISDLHPDQVNPEWKKEGEDWVVTYNPKATVLQKDRFDVNMVHNFDQDSVVCVVRFSACGKFLAAGCNQFVHVYDTETGSKIASLQEEKTEDKLDMYVRTVCFSPDSSLLATGAENKGISVWDLSTKTIKATLTGHLEDTYSLDWSKDGKYLYSGSGDRTIRVWSVDRAACIRVLKDDSEMGHPNEEPKDAGVSTLSLNPTYPRCIAAGSLDRVIRIWDISTGRLLERFEGHKASVYSVAFSPDGTSLVSGAFDKTVRVWDLSTTTLNYFANHSNGEENQHVGSPEPKYTITTTCRHIFAGHNDFVLSVAYAGLNAHLGRVDENGDPVATPGGDALAEVEWIVSSSKDKSVIFWDAGRGTSGDELVDPHTVAQFSLQGHRKSVISVALSPVGGLFATGSGDHRVRVWRVSADRDGLASLPPAGPAHHSATSSQASMTPGTTSAFAKPASSTHGQASSTVSTANRPTATVPSTTTPNIAASLSPGQGTPVVSQQQISPVVGGGPSLVQDHHMDTSLEGSAIVTAPSKYAFDEVDADGEDTPTGLSEMEQIEGEEEEQQHVVHEIKTEKVAEPHPEEQEEPKEMDA